MNPLSAQSALSHSSHNDDFRYRPLDCSKQSIRLIRILPDFSDEGLIMCEMWHASCQSEYQCLSYRWGSPADPSTVLIKDIQSDHLDGRPCSVGQNLHEFLNAAQGHAELGDTFWIDALCIDQSNESEKKHQVKQMANIYSQATSVVIWLGNYSRPYHWYGTTFDDRAYHDAWEEFSKNEYWTRAWITQEFVLARDINFLVGKILLPYSELCARNSQRRIHDLIVSRNRYEKVRDSLWHRFWLQKTSLWRDFFLLEIHRVQCTIPRDRIFAMLALLKEGDQIEVDYQIPAYELAYRLCQLNTKRTYLSCVLTLLSVIRDDAVRSNELIGVAGPFVEFRTYFTGLGPRASDLQDTIGLYVVDTLLEGKGLGSATTISGRGFTITRSDSQSLLLNVRVALSTLSDFDNLRDPFRLPYLHVVKDPKFEVEFQAWASSSLLHRIYNFIFGTTRRSTEHEWSAVKVGYQPTPNGVSIPSNIACMGCALALSALGFL